MSDPRVAELIRKATEGGTSIEMYPPGAGDKIMWYGGAAVFLAAGVFCLAAWPLQLRHPPRQAAGLIYFALLLGIAVILPASWYCFRRAENLRFEAIMLFPEALVVQQSRTDYLLFPWGEIATVWKDHYFTNNRRALAGYKYDVHRNDGLHCWLSAPLVRRRGLIEKLEQETLRRMLPLARQLIESGRTAEFGRLGVRRAALVVDEKAIPWDKLGCFYVNAYHGMVEFSVGDSGSDHWHFPPKTIPNRHVFLALVKELANLPKDS